MQCFYPKVVYIYLISLQWLIGCTILFIWKMSEDADIQSPSKALLQSWLNKIIKVKISDGRRLIGSFLCTDQEMNIILGSCQEFVYDEGTSNKLFNNLFCTYCTIWHFEYPIKNIIKVPRLKNMHLLTAMVQWWTNWLQQAGRKHVSILHLTLRLSNTYLHCVDNKNEEPRILGLAMIPGKHIVSLEIDEQSKSQGIKIDSSSEANDSSTEPATLPATWGWRVVSS